MTTEKLDPTRCAQSVSDGGPWIYRHQCRNKMVAGEGGFCRLHGPTREAARDAEWEKRSAAHAARLSGWSAEGATAATIAWALAHPDFPADLAAELRETTGAKP